jgi:hypothetical protein
MAEDCMVNQIKLRAVASQEGKTGGKGDREIYPFPVIPVLGNAASPEALPSFLAGLKRPQYLAQGLTSDEYRRDGGTEGRGNSEGGGRNRGYGLGINW